MRSVRFRALLVTGLLLSTVVSGGVATATASLSGTPDANGFIAMAPIRVLDTRNGTGGQSGPLAGNASLVLDLSATVPAAATAVVLNLTGVGATVTTFVTAFPDGSPRPTASNLNLVPNQIAPNLVTVALGPGSKIDLFNHAGTVDLVADLAGYYTPDSAATFTALSPTRVLDTRTTNTPLGPNTTRVLDLSASVPANATAVVLNLTGVNASSSTFVTAFPDGAPRPTASNLNLVKGQIAPNLVTVALGTGGKVDLYNLAGSVDLLADLAGYFAPNSAATFSSLNPARVLDTRTGGVITGPTPVGPNSDIVLDLSTRVPANATAVVLNLTGADPSSSTFVTAFPDGSSRPTASNLNLVAGQVAPNLVTVALGPGGKIDLYNFAGSVDLVADLAGYFAPDGPACTSGCVVAWGDNPHGETGNRTKGGEADTPVPLFGLSGVTAIAGTMFNGYALKNDGTVWAWGENWGDQTQGVASCITNADDSTSVCATDVPVRVPGLSDITAIAGGGVDINTGFALRSDGTVWRFFAVSNASNGQVRTVDQLPILQNITKIVAGHDNGYALKNDGTVWAWGDNGNGQLGNGQTCTNVCDFFTPVQVSGLTGVTAIGGGSGQGYAVKADGTLWAWGNGALGLHTGTNSGTTLTPVQVTGLSGVTAVAATAGGTGFALKTDGTVWAWGSNSHGELGTGTPDNTTTFVPAQVSALTGVAAIGAGVVDGYAVRTDGTVWSWGDNEFGALGNGTDSITGPATFGPVQVSGLTGATAVTGGNEFAFALTQ